MRVILDDLFATEEMLAIERQRKIDDAILDHLNKTWPAFGVIGTGFVPSIPHVVHTLIRPLISSGKLARLSPDEIYRTRIKQLRAWGWFSQGPEDLTEEE